MKCPALLLVLNLSVLDLLLCHWLSLTIQRSMGVISGVRLFSLACSRNREEQTLYEFRHSFSPCTDHKPQPILKKNCCNIEDTNSALCLSSARIWSLGFRVYLQIIKRRKKEALVSQSHRKHILHQTLLFYPSNPATVLFHKQTPQMCLRK